MPQEKGRGARKFQNSPVSCLLSGVHILKGKERAHSDVGVIIYTIRLHGK
jgi:hypothetical protein